MELQVFDTFDYTVKTFRDTKVTDLTNKLNELGKEGWELITVLQNAGSHPTYIFKRKLTILK